MTRGVYRIAAIGAVSAVALVVAFGALITQPSIATPLARQLLSGGEGASVGRAWVSYGPWPIAHLRTIELEGRGHAERVDARINPLGLLPGVGLIPRLAVEEGALLLELGGAGGEAPGILGEVKQADLTSVRLDILRPDREPQVLVIGDANGNLRSGSFIMTGEGGGATIEIEGSAAGLSLAAFEGRITVEGENFATLATLLGFAAPDTPAYRLSGDLSRSDETWSFAPFDGTVGDSDMAGSLAVDFAGEKPFVRADLQSMLLDFDDLGIVVGAPAPVETVAPNERQQEIAAEYETDGRALPDTELDVERIGAVDAEIRFRADAVDAGPVPLEELSALVRLDDSVLTFEEILFTAPQGRLEASGELDAQDPNAVHGALEGELEGFELAQLGGGRLLRGRLNAEFDVNFAGRRTRDAFASLAGEAGFWSTDAEIRALAEEGAGLDLGEVLTLLLSESEENPEFRPARCLAARATFEEGVATLDPAVLDTADSVTRVRGGVDLETEAFDLTVETDAKDFSWGRLLGNVGVSGTMRDPAVDAPIGEATLQSGAAALLGGLTAGLAALPFFEPGLGEDAPCAALMAAAQRDAQGGEPSQAAED